MPPLGGRERRVKPHPDIFASPCPRRVCLWRCVLRRRVRGLLLYSSGGAARDGGEAAPAGAAPRAGRAERRIQPAAQAQKGEDLRGDAAAEQLTWE